MKGPWGVVAVVSRLQARAAVGGVPVSASVMDLIAGRIDQLIGDAVDRISAAASTPFT